MMVDEHTRETADGLLIEAAALRLGVGVQQVRNYTTDGYKLPDGTRLHIRTWPDFAGKRLRLYYSSEDVERIADAKRQAQA